MTKKEADRLKTAIGRLEVCQQYVPETKKTFYWVPRHDVITLIDLITEEEEKDSADETKTCKTCKYYDGEICRRVDIPCLAYCLWESKNYQKEAHDCSTCKYHRECGIGICCSLDKPCKNYNQWESKE